MEIKFKFNDIPKITKDHVLPFLKKDSILTFTGPLGAGKTTLIREILTQCGIKENITSPTFNYVNTYKTEDGRFFNHFDLFRINSLDSFLTSGFDEFFYKKNNINLIEWPEVISNLLQEDQFKKNIFNIYLHYVENSFDVRLLKILP